MVAKINGYLNGGPVRFIEFRVEPRSSEASRLTDEGANVNNVKVPPSIAIAAENIGDPSLRARFLETAAEYLSRQQVDS
jgi:hypothetical protein